MKAQQLDSANAARIAALVIRDEEGRGKFATFLRKVVPAVWETGSQEPDHHYDAARMRACGDLATAARKLLVAIKTIKKGYSWFGAFDNLEHELERIVPMAEQVFRRRGRPKRIFKDGFELFVGRVLVAITTVRGPRPTCNRHHQSGTLVDLLVALRPYLPPNFVPEHLDNWPWAKLERLASAKSAEVLRHYFELERLLSAERRDGVSADAVRNKSLLT